jgi:DNA-binding NtrC family response regulator
MAKAKILVCDDEKNLRKAIRLILERDYELVFAEDGEDALQQFTNGQPFDLVLLDIKMPKKDGLEVLQELMAVQPPPRVLMLTAYQSLELAQRATKAGAVDYVTKPFERQALLKAVDRALDLRTWQRSTPAQ